MIYAKSESGLQAVKDRHAVDLTRAQRSVLILIDGKRSVREVLEATATLGVTATDVELLVQRGLVVVASGGMSLNGSAGGASLNGSSGGAGRVTATGDGAASGSGDPAAPDLTDDERARRYRVAYPLATQLTAKLGLKGFRLNLAVEEAAGFEGLVDLLPRLRSALGSEGVRPLESVLIGDPLQ